MADTEGRMAEIAARLEAIVDRLEAEDADPAAASELAGEAARLTAEALDEIEQAMRSMARTDE